MRVVNCYRCGLLIDLSENPDRLCESCQTKRYDRSGGVRR
jgi:NMD protein affecting ribosome stability and mRNA decay